MSVTVLIPAHNEEKTIERCLDAVTASRYPLDRIIVVAYSGKGSDRTAELARPYGVEVQATEIIDKAEKQNSVLDSITTDLVIGFDGDTFPDPHCIKKMVSAIHNRKLDAVCSTVLPVQPKGFFIRARRFAYALGRRWWRAAQSEVGRVQVLTGASYVFRTEAIKAVGGFPSVGISADMDATWALHRAGYKLAYIGDSIAYTVDPETWDDYKKQMRRWAAGYFQTMAKHRKGLLHPRAMLVVWTGMFDLLMLPVSYGFLVYWIYHDPSRVKWYWLWILAHMVVNMILVATVVGVKEAVLGVIPYTLVNFYNKGLYLWTFVREWIIGAKYSAWTGARYAGRTKAIQAPSFVRSLGLLNATLALVLVLLVSTAVWR